MRLDIGIGEDVLPQGSTRNFCRRLIDDDRGGHAGPVVVGAARGEQALAKRNKVDVDCLLRVQEKRAAPLVEHAGVWLQLAEEAEREADAKT